MPQSAKISFNSQTEIVAAYVRHNQVPVSEISNVIRGVHQSLGGADERRRRRTLDFSKARHHRQTMITSSALKTA